jgi:hypothetical protein
VSDDAGGRPASRDKPAWRAGDFGLGGVNTHDQPQHGNAFSARDVDPKTPQFLGPVMFAVRILPREGAPEAQRRLYVVYTKERTIFVAEKPVTESRWIPRLLIEAPNANWWSRSTLIGH